MEENCVTIILCISLCDCFARSEVRVGSGSKCDEGLTQVARGAETSRERLPVGRQRLRRCWEDDEIQATVVSVS